MQPPGPPPAYAPANGDFTFVSSADAEGEAEADLRASGAGGWQSWGTPPLCSLGLPGGLWGRGRVRGAGAAGWGPRVSWFTREPADLVEGVLSELRSAVTQKSEGSKGEQSGAVWLCY